MFAAQPGYCSGRAFESLNKMGNTENLSIALPGSPVNAVDSGNKADKAMSFSKDPDKLSDLAGTTPFEKLESLFNEGVPASEKDLTGWYSGRAVFKSDPCTFYGKLFVGKRLRSNSGGGPLFAGEEIFQGTLIRNQSLEYFDSITPEIIHEVARAGGTVVITFPAAAGGTTYKTTVTYRKARGYIVEQIQDNNSANAVYTYYFKNVTPK